jgi:hypothetical protein
VRGMTRAPIRVAFGLSGQLSVMTVGALLLRSLQEPALSFPKGRVRCCRYRINGSERPGHSPNCAKCGAPNVSVALARSKASAHPEG